MTPPELGCPADGEPAGADPYVNPATGVLRNRLGLTDPEQLEDAEADFSAVRLAGLGRRPLSGNYDLAHLQRFHDRIFGDVYPWAGELRTVVISKGGTFCLPQHLETVAVEVFGRLAATDHLRGRDRDRFVDGLTELLADLNALHPFREGNGRTQRAFCTQLARAAPSTTDPMIGADRAQRVGA